MATRVNNLDSLTIGRPVSLVPLVRRSTYLGAGQFDITNDGTLVYAPGLNAEIGSLVRRERDGGITMFKVDEAAHLRFTPSPDGQRMATVVEGVEQQELRVYDLQVGTHQAYDKGFYVSAPAWSPDGTRLVYRRNTDPANESLLWRRLDAPGAPQILLSQKSPLVTQPSAWLADNFLLVGVGINDAQVMLINPTTTPPTVDSLGFSSFFASISPDRRWIAMQNQGATGIRLQPWPARDREYQVDAGGTEPRWRSATELAFQVPGTNAVFQVTINGAASSPVGKRTVIMQDARFADTPGWSYAFMTTGELVYLRSPVDNPGYYLRVVPHWVDQMKRAVDAVNK